MIKQFCSILLACGVFFSAEIASADADSEYSIFTGVPERVSVDRATRGVQNLPHGELFLGEVFKVKFRVDQHITDDLTPNTYTAFVPASGAAYFKNARFYFVVRKSNGKAVVISKVINMSCISEVDASVGGVVKLYPYKLVNIDPVSAEKDKLCAVANR